jgi:hypothetical protein
VAQVENVAIAVYKVDTRPGLYVTHRLRFTHAWLPQDHFDEVVEQRGWILARRGDGYLALRSQQPYHWQTTEPGEDRGREVLAPGTENVWICELGRRAVDGPFDEFVQRIVGAELSFRRLGVRYHSPSQGWLEFGWRAPLRQDGTEVPLGGYPRYDNPYARATFPADQIDIHHQGHHLALDWPTANRRASALIQ